MDGKDFIKQTKLCSIERLFFGFVYFTEVSKNSCKIFGWFLSGRAPKFAMFSHQNSVVYNFSS